MHVLVVNCGSTSLKTAIVDAESGQRVGAVVVDRIGQDAGAARHPWYLRVPVRDELGVLGQITQGLGAAGISVSRILQDRPSPDGPVQVVLMTHSATFASVLQFESCVRGETWCLGAVQAIPIEEGV